MQKNYIYNNTTKENARVTGKVVGDIVIAVLVTKGLEKGTAALKASANSGKLAQSVKGVVNGTDSIDDAARILSGGNYISRAQKLVFGSDTKSFQKLMNQMYSRGWTENLIKDTVGNPFTIRSSINKATGNLATVFYTKRGSYVIVDDITNEIVQISDNINPINWIPDSSIQNPYSP